MSKTIQKLNKLKNPESFIQVNTVKGFKYIDRAGEIVNLYHKKDAAPQFSMNLNGLIVEEPVEKIDQLKVTSQVFWIKSSTVDSLDMLATTFTQETEKVLNVLEVEKLNRVGWRNYFVHEFKDKNEQEEYLKKFTVIENTLPLILRLEVKTGKDFSANLVLQPVVKEEENKTFGVLFDIDLFKNGEIEKSDIGKLLKDFREYLADDDGFLSVVNQTFN